MSKTTEITKKRGPVRGEAKVRDYLTFLSDPQTAVNKAAVGKARKAFERAQDPMDKLRLRQDWLDAKSPDGSKLEDGFVDVAFEWATRKGIAVENFISQGVPRKVLRKAGFPVTVGTYKPRVSGSVVREAIQRQKEAFTVQDIIQATDASEAGVRNVLAAMVEEGALVTIPVDHAGFHGKAPTHYQNVVD